MATAPFAPLQQRLNGTVLRRLANAEAMVGGVAVPVIFDRPYIGPFGGQIDAMEPVCTGASADLAGLERDSALTIDGAEYRVATAEPEGTGLTRLALYRPGD